MKTQTSRTSSKSNRSKKRTASGKINHTVGKRSVANLTLKTIVCLCVGYGSYKLGMSFSDSLHPKSEFITAVSLASLDGVAEYGKKSQAGKGRSKGKNSVKGAGGSVFSEGDAPVVIGEVPEGWRVETSPDIKAKFGPHPVPGGEDITFVVPVYTLVPEEGRPGAYVMEPGRGEKGEDAGGTISAVLGRIETETETVSKVLGSLATSLDGLSRYSTNAQAQ